MPSIQTPIWIQRLENQGLRERRPALVVFMWCFVRGFGEFSSCTWQSSAVRKRFQQSKCRWFCLLIQHALSACHRRCSSIPKPLCDWLNSKLDQQFVATMNQIAVGCFCRVFRAEVQIEKVVDGLVASHFVANSSKKDALWSSAVLQPATYTVLY